MKQSNQIVKALKSVAIALALPVAMFVIMEALAFFTQGEHIIKICNGTACHLRGSVNLATELKRILGIEPGQTSADGEFSVEYVNCLGSCALAPVMVVDGVYHNKLKVDQISGIVESYRTDDSKDVVSND